MTLNRVCGIQTLLFPGKQNICNAAPFVLKETFCKVYRWLLVEKKLRSQDTFNILESTAPPNAKCRPPTKSCFESWYFFVTLNWLTKKAIYIQLKTYLAAIFFSLIMIHNLWFLEHFLIEYSIMQTKCIWSLQWDLIVRAVFNWAWKIIWPFIGFASLDCLCPENLCCLLGYSLNQTNFLPHAKQ